MKDNLAKIRTALEWGEGPVFVEALAALAELEKAAAEPSRWECEYANGNDETMVDILPFAPEGPSFYDKITPLYTTPPPAKPAPQYVAGEIDDAMIERVFQRAAWDFADGSTRVTYKMLQAWRSELGPTLGLVELKEPTPEECERIENQFTVLNMRLETPTGRDMFDAVRAVLWPKEGV